MPMPWEDEELVYDDGFEAALYQDGLSRLPGDVVGRIEATGAAAEEQKGGGGQ